MDDLSTMNTKFSSDTRMCQGIMCQVAQNEDRRIRRFFLIMIPTTSGLLLASALSGYTTVTHLIQKEFFAIVQTVQIDFHFGPKSEILTQMVLEEVANGNLVVFFVAISTLATVVVKYDLLSYPYRMKEIGKYKN